MKQTAVEFLVEKLDDQKFITKSQIYIAEKMEKQNTDNKVIHFAEWLTKKHPFTLIALYEQFEEQHYSETFKQDETD
jgi:hypothetical protein